MTFIDLLMLHLIVWVLHGLCLDGDYLQARFTFAFLAFWTSVATVGLLRLRRLRPLSRVDWVLLWLGILPLWALAFPANDLMLRWKGGAPGLLTFLVR